MFSTPIINPDGDLPDVVEVNTTGELLCSGEVVEIEPGDSAWPQWVSYGERIALPLIGVRSGTSTGRTHALAVVRSRKAPLIVEDAGRVILNFDFPGTMDFIINEGYREYQRPLMSYLPINYHAAPEFLRAAVSRIVTAAAVNVRSAASSGGFPNFPIEKSLEALVCVFRCACGMENAPGIATDQEFCVVLSHDLDEANSLRGIALLAGIEKDFGAHSVWFAAGKLFPKHMRRIEKLRDDGNEIGLHAVLHDLRFPFLSERRMRARLDGAGKWTSELGIKGFRSPYYLRSSRMFRVLEDFFAYDSSMPDADTFSPGTVRGGCALVRPFRLGRLVEFPVTLPFEVPHLAGIAPARLVEFWKEKIEFVRAAHGLLVVNTHPDAHASGNSAMAGAYRGLLYHLEKTGARFVLPSEMLREAGSR